MKDFPILKNSLGDNPVVLQRNGLLNSSPLTIMAHSAKPPVEGTQALVQMVLKGILTSPGYNVFVPEIGAGIASFIGNTFNGRKLGSLKTNFIMFVKSVENKIKEIQGSMTNISVEETLKSITVSRFRLNTMDELEIIINIYNEAGDYIPTSVTI
jgi:uncharacterized membrane protein